LSSGENREAAGEAVGKTREAVGGAVGRKERQWCEKRGSGRGGGEKREAVGQAVGEAVGEAMGEAVGRSGGRHCATAATALLRCLVMISVACVRASCRSAAVGRRSLSAHRHRAPSALANAHIFGP